MGATKILELMSKVDALDLPPRALDKPFLMSVKHMRTRMLKIEKILKIASIDADYRHCPAQHNSASVGSALHFGQRGGSPQVQVQARTCWAV